MLNATTKVASLNNPVNASLDDARQWIRQRGAAGHYNSSTARFYTSAIEAFESVLDDSEPRTAQHMLENVETIGKRWAVKTQATNGGTVRTYISRARAVLSDYLRFLDDPAKFESRARSPGDPKAPRLPRERPQREKASSVAPTDDRTGRAPPAPPSTTTTHELRLGDGRVFRFILPETFTVKDAKRVAWHVTTLADDFDPPPHVSPVGNPMPGSIVRDER